MKGGGKKGQTRTYKLIQVGLETSFLKLVFSKHRIEK